MMHHATEDCVTLELPTQGTETEGDRVLHTSVLFSDPPYTRVQPRLAAPALQSAAHSKTSLKGTS